MHICRKSQPLNHNPNKKNNHMNQLKYITAVLIALVGFGLQQAGATAVPTSTIGTPNDDISGFTGPYGFVNIVLTSSTTATVTFTSNTVGGNIYLMGDSSSADLNVDASSFTVSGISGTNAGTGFTPGPFSLAKAGQVDGFGTFNLRIDSFDGFTHSSDTITFTVTNTGGTWTSATNVLAPNGLGFDAAMHVFVTASPAVASAGAVATGFAGETGVPGVPDGGTTAMLLGAALSALGLVGRFVKR
jgi:hypothetical protein